MNQGNPRDNNGKPTDNREHTDFMDVMNTEEGKKLAARLMGNPSVKENPNRIIPQKRGGNRKSKKNKKTEKRKIGKGKISKTGKGKISKTRSIRKSRKNITGGTGSRMAQRMNQYYKEVAQWNKAKADYEREQQELKNKGIIGYIEAFLIPYPEHPLDDF